MDDVSPADDGVAILITVRGCRSEGVPSTVRHAPIQRSVCAVSREVSRGVSLTTLLPMLLVMSLPLRVSAQAASDSAARGGDERGALRLGSGSDVTLTLGGYVQVDGRWISGASGRQPDGVLLRRARVVFDAVIRDGWHVRVQPDFGQGRVLVQDAFVGREHGALALRAGRFRPAFGTERMQSSSTLLSPERGIVNSLMPSRSFGAQMVVIHGAWRLAVGGFRTPIGTDVAPVDTDGDVDAGSGSGHDVLLRISHVRTWSGGYADVQAGVLTGSERGTTDSPALARVLSVAQQPLIVFRGTDAATGASTGAARAAGARTRLSTGAMIGTAATMLAVESALFTQRVEHAGVVRSPTIGAATVRVARVWNGTRTPAQEIAPRSATGAIDVGARGGVVGAWGDGLPSILSRNSVTHVHTAGVAISWLPSVLTRVTLAYDLTARRRSSAPLEHALVGRWQQGF